MPLFIVVWKTKTDSTPLSALTVVSCQEASGPEYVIGNEFTKYEEKHFNKSQMTIEFTVKKN